jgi:hypothetical protein
MALFCSKWMLLSAIFLPKIEGFSKITTGIVTIRRERSFCLAVPDGDDANQAKDNKSGVFRLPKDNEVFPLLNNYFLEPELEEVEQPGSLDPTTRNSIVRQLEMAFDNYQPWEIIEMSEKLFLMPQQLEKVREIVRRLESIEVYAEKQGGWDENLVDALRSSRSQVRMWAKDTEFYDTKGNKKEQVSMWPWNRR